MFWTMNPEGSDGRVQASCQDSYRWFHHRRSWQRSRLHLSAQQPLDRYEWTTSVRLVPTLANVAAPEGGGQTRDWRWLHRSSTVPANQTRADSGRRIFPYLRSTSEPTPESTGGGEVGSHGGCRASTNNLFSTISQKISRVLLDRPGPESGRRPTSCL